MATGIYDDSKRVVIDPSSPYAAIVGDVDNLISGMIAGGSDPAIVASAIVSTVADPTSRYAALCLNPWWFPDVDGRRVVLEGVGEIR